MANQYNILDVHERSLPRWRVGAWYDTKTAYAGTSSQSIQTVNRIIASPVYVPYPTRVDRIGINVSTAAAGLARLMVYRANENGLPGDLVLDAGTVDVGTTGDKELTIDLFLPAGLVFCSAVCSSAATIQSLTQAGVVALFGTLTVTQATAAVSSSYRDIGSTTAPTPSFGTPDGFTTTFVRVGLRAAA